MLPIYLIELKDTISSKDVMKKYFHNQYPESNDCVVMDKHIADIQKDIDEINKRSLQKYIELNSLNPLAIIESQSLRAKAKEILNQLLIKKKNLVALADCRNKIETVRQEETAQVFTETSAQAETRVLGETKKKQYLLIGVGAVVVITSLVLFIVKRKK